MSRMDPHAEVILWRCPNCGKVETNTGQSARYCGWTRACTTRSKRGDITLTSMERVTYVPKDAPR